MDSGTRAALTASGLTYTDVDEFHNFQVAGTEPFKSKHGSIDKDWAEKVVDPLNKTPLYVAHCTVKNAKFVDFSYHMDIPNLNSLQTTFPPND